MAARPRSDLTRDEAVDELTEFLDSKTPPDGALAADWNELLERQRERLRGWDADPASPANIVYFGKQLFESDPLTRDRHLEQLDPWILPVLRSSSLAYAELTEVVRRLPRVRAGLAPAAMPLGEALWRWLCDAERRRLVTEEETIWTITALGERNAQNATGTVTGRIVRTVAANVGVVATVIALAAAVVGAGPLSQTLQGWLETVRPAVTEYGPGVLGMLLTVDPSHAVRTPQ